MQGIFEELRSNPLAALIGLCEIGFWVMLGAGLAARYLLKLRRTSNVLLISTPLLDVVLLIATVVDLARGSTASSVHGIGAAYLGFSVAFGHSLIRWADQRVAYRFAGGPPPVKPPAHDDPKRIGYEWREWGKCLLAWAIACGAMLLLVLIAGSPDRTEALWAWMGRLSTVLLIWLVAGPLWTTFSTTSKAGVR
ncbi:hypothetical protein [Nocardia huaxiensis]|uniref:Membrane protein YmcC n=1 Tax=Nocardia huaxiensis TaxID=2755382 RepID=A0A7D6ZRE3_9NOCA|nr:hypothetical protein [Nocardia huaxiensis]QLY33523.1 hypothetical protein H0264_15960 [Nocardia huaxiensis]UFS99559.1 hypothetical protein LPY97_17555 [Nocardia huaxiensis]